MDVSDVNLPVIGEESFDPQLYSVVTRAKTIDDYKILRICQVAYNAKDPEKETSDIEVCLQVKDSCRQLDTS
ncbi:1312_t:CDS:2 [Paraglomus occultum]|uniref:1312_t:CDS:1 n=1 Tax=Paraglomus occultum TaxID=144539 RepID=A0A9N9H5D1_9GLOM|nr:1312_t:CDS:2 [Paraglomus occultum]